MGNFEVENILHPEGVHPRRYLHRHTALEIQFVDGTPSVRLHFDEEAESSSKRLPTTTSSPDITGSTFSSTKLSRKFREGRGAAASETGTRRTVSADVSVRDEVFYVLATLRKHCLVDEDGDSDDDVVSVPISASKSVIDQLEGEVKRQVPAPSWARGAGCRTSKPPTRKPVTQTRRGRSMSLPAVRISGVGSRTNNLFGMADDALEAIDFVRKSDVTRMMKSYQKAMDKRKESLMKEWQDGDLSNFGYLHAVNSLSGRSLEDLSQYPVMPWVLTNMLDTDPPSTVLSRQNNDAEIEGYFRDLSKTLGDMGDPRRREQLLEKYAGLEDEESISPPYHYGSHYSTPAFVMNFLIRLQPFTGLASEMQGGKFDVADRIFSSLPETWRSCKSEMSDVRELTPELFSLPECLLNVGGLAFGTCQDGCRVDHVKLPSWARDAYHFIHEHRLALESAPVSKRLHGWIDLVWGQKQLGQAAVEAINKYFWVTYSELDWSKLDQGVRHSTEQQVLHFGQCPPQLYEQGHPAKELIYQPSLFDGKVVQRCAFLMPKGSSASPVVALVADDDAHVFVLQANGTLSSWSVLSRSKGETLMQFEESYQPPRSEDVDEKFLMDMGLTLMPEVWALVANQRFFIRGGLRDGSLVFGRFSFGRNNEIGWLRQAHSAPVTVVAASEKCARYVPVSHGLVVVTGAGDGTVSVWTPADARWRALAPCARWQLHLTTVRCLDCDSSLGMVVSGGKDGLVNLIQLRPPMRPLRTFLFEGGHEVSQVHFGCRAPVSLVAASKEGLICVWALHGFLLATFQFSQAPLHSLRCVQCDDAQEALLCAANGVLQLRMLPYLDLVWERKTTQIHQVLGRCPTKRLALLGYHDGSFEAFYAETERARPRSRSETLLSVVDMGPGGKPWGTRFGNKVV